MRLSSLSIPNVLLQDTTVPPVLTSLNILSPVHTSVYVLATLGSPWWSEFAFKVLQLREHEQLGTSRKRILHELKVCSSLERGCEIHEEARRGGTDSCIYVATALVGMYAKCNNMVEAQRVFDSIDCPDVVSWTSLILGYVENGDCITALDMFTRMKSQGCAPNSFTFVAAIKACTFLATDKDEKTVEDCLERGRQLHLECGCHLNAYVRCTLIDMYAKCKVMVEARHVFEGMKHPDVASWNALILGYAENAKGDVALDLLVSMKRQGYTPTSFTFVAALKACTSLALEDDGKRRGECLERVKQIHLEIDCHSNAYVKNALMNMYSKCGSMVDAQRVFDGISHPDLVAWNTLIMGYAENREGAKALGLFETMKRRCCSPDVITLVAIVKACTSQAMEQDKYERSECLHQARKIHSEIGCISNLCVQTALVEMYAKCGSMSDARSVFESIMHPDVVSWNVLIMGYAENGEGGTGLGLLSRMRSQGFVPNSMTLVAALKACTSFEDDRIECLEKGRELHAQIDCPLDIYLVSALIDMYSKCMSMADAKQVFDNTENPNIVAWTALISGYTENGESVTALDLFAKMKQQGCLPNPFTFTAVIKACALLGDLQSGKSIHAEIDIEMQRETMLVTCLVDFYAKCGSLGDARKVFDSHPRSLVTANALLAGYSRVGDVKSALDLFKELDDTCFQPNGVTMLCILTCCGHSGLVDKGKKYFNAMLTKYGLTPAVQHYNCMADILGRSNEVDEAMVMLRSMHCRPDLVTWMTILSACRKCKNVRMGTLAFKSLLSIDNTWYAPAYVLMARVFESRGMYKEKEMVLEMKRRFNWKELGQTCWTNDKEVHTFIHPLDSKI